MHGLGGKRARKPTNPESYLDILHCSKAHDAVFPLEHSVILERPLHSMGGSQQTL